MGEPDVEILLRDLLHHAHEIAETSHDQQPRTPKIVPDIRRTDQIVIEEVTIDLIIDLRIAPVEKSRLRIRTRSVNENSLPCNKMPRSWMSTVRNDWPHLQSRRRPLESSRTKHAQSRRNMAIRVILSTAYIARQERSLWVTGSDVGSRTS